jgi:DNA-binding NarL/FixJ family response regulator
MLMLCGPTYFGLCNLGMVVQQRVKVFVFCCNRLLGQSIAHILGKRQDFRVATGLPMRGTSLDESCYSTDVVVLDSLQLLATRRNLPSPPPLDCQPRFLLIAMEENRDQFLRAIRHGVSGYVLQDASALDVVAAIKAVAQGDAVCPPRMARALFDYVAKQASRNSNSARAKALTRREQDLVPLIGNGLTNKEIAARLNLSEETIKSHIHRILRKVGVENRRSVFEACQITDFEA